MKKAANLNKRLNELRDEPEPPVKVVLQVDAELHRMLKKLAGEAHLTLEAYVVKIVSEQAETAVREDKAGQSG